jgi:predicted metal-dependent hydrolase
LERKNRFSEPTKQEIESLRRRAKEILPKKVEYYSKLTGLSCTGVKITSAKTRFGSCNGKNSICFSYHLMRYPEEAIDYVVLHELAHTKHHDHSWRFWLLVGLYMPDYKQRRALLKG